MKIRSVALFIITGLFCSRIAVAQCVPVVDDDSSQFIFESSPTTGASYDLVYTTLIQGNTMYFGGHFFTLGQKTGHFMALDTARGMIQGHATWPKINGTVYKAIPDDAGGWIVGGNFTQAGDSLRNNLVQIDASAHVTAFNPGTDNSVRSLVVVGPNLYVGGDFKHIGGTARNRVAKVSLATSAVATWNANSDSTVSELEYLGGKVYAGGFFANIGGAARNYVAKLDTTTGTAISWNANATGSCVNTIIFHAGLMYVGGAFTNIGGATRNNAAALDTGTALANGWNPNVGGTVYKIFHKGATVYIAGSYYSVGAAARYSIAEVDSATGDTTAFNPAGDVGATYFFGNTVYYDMAVTGASIFLGGYYTYPYPGIPGAYHINYISKIDIPSSTYDTAWCYSDLTVYTLSLSGGKLYVGGDFVELGYKIRYSAAAIDLLADTITSWNPGPLDYVYSLAAGQGRIYMGGSFTSLTAGGISTPLYLVSTDPVTGVPDPAFHPSITYPSTVTKVIYSDSNLYIAGDFSGISGYTRNSVAKVSATTGALDLVWNPAPAFTTGSVSALAADSNNIYIGGAFSVMGGPIRDNLAAVDKVSGAATAWNPSPSGPIYALSINNGKMYVGGYFSSIGGGGNTNLARLSLASGLPDSWSPNPNNELHVITPYYNTEFIAGEFDHINTTSLVNGLGSVNTVNNVPMPWNPAPGYDSVYDIAVWRNRMYVTGGFSSISAQDNYPALIAYRLATLPDTNSIAGPAVSCAGVRDEYTASTSVAGSSYQWLVNGVAEGTDADTFSYVPVTGDVIECVTTPPSAATVCYTTDSAMSNVITVTVTPLVTPSVTISGPDSICTGSTQTYASATVIPSPAYLWRVNGVGAGSASSYTYAPSNGDLINLRITPPSSGCYSADSAVSSTITVFEGPPIVPVINIAGPGYITAGTLVTVNAIVSSAGSSYQIRWYVNGAFIVATTTPVFTYVKSPGTDAVTATIYPLSAGCYDSAGSNAVTIIDVSGVAQVAAGSNLSVYPNPNNGAFTILLSSPTDETAEVVVTNALGEKVKAIAIKSNTATDLALGQPAGTYFISVHTDGEYEETKALLIR